MLTRISKRYIGNVCPKITNIPVSPTLHINETVNELKQKGKQVFHFGFGQSPFPVPNKMVEALKKHAHEKDYLPTRGLLQLRKEISFHFENTFSVPQFMSENIMIGPGSKQLIYQIFMLFDGEIILPSPSWVSYYPQCKLADKHVSILKTSKENNWHITPEDLDKLCENNPSKPKLILLNTPCNPTGQYYSKDELEALSVIFKKHKIIVIADEIYGLLHFNGTHSSISSYYPEGTIVCSGISKAFGAGGWRLGFSAFPPQLSHFLHPMDCIASETFSAVSAPIQYGSIPAYENDSNMTMILKKQSNILSGVANFVHKRLTNSKVTVLKPQGGFYMLPIFDNYRNKLENKGIKTSSELCQRLLKDTGVAILPGNSFLQDNSMLSARLAFVNFNGKNALDQYKHIENTITEDFIKENCKDTVIGVEKLCNWLEKL